MVSYENFLKFVYCYTKGDLAFHALLAILSRSVIARLSMQKLLIFFCCKNH